MGGDDLLPGDDYPRIWQHVDEALDADKACHYIVRLLHLAKMSDVMASLPLMLKRLRLGSIKDHWQPLADKAVTEHWRPEQYLSELCALELDSREDKRLQRYLKEVTLPLGKQLGSFNFDAVTGVTKPHISQLIDQSDWVKRGDNLLLFGASGSGKTHLASSIGYGLIEAGIRVKFVAATA